MSFVDSPLGQRLGPFRHVAVEDQVVTSPACVRLMAQSCARNPPWSAMYRLGLLQLPNNDREIHVDSLDPPVVLLILGGVCVLAAFFGGMTGTISLPTLGRGGRIGAGAVGFILIISGTGLWLWTDLRKDTTKATPLVSPSPSRSSAVPDGTIDGNPSTLPPRSGLIR
jgi:hypothetical protein